MLKNFIYCLMILSSLSSPVFGSAPTGAPPANAEDAFSQSAFVFTGKVREVYKDAYGYNSTADVVVEKCWKCTETLSSIIKINGKGGPTYPARIFEIGETYLFYLPPLDLDKSLRADSYLHRVLKVSDATQDFVYLNKK